MILGVMYYLIANSLCERRLKLEELEKAVNEYNLPCAFISRIYVNIWI